MSEHLCDDCRRINLNTLLSHWAHRTIEFPPSLNRHLLRDRHQLSTTCPMCQLISSEIEKLESQYWVEGSKVKRFSLRAAFDIYRMMQRPIAWSIPLARRVEHAYARVALARANQRAKRGIHPQSRRVEEIRVQVEYDRVPGSRRADGDCHAELSLDIFASPLESRRTRFLVLGEPYRATASPDRAGWIQDWLKPCMASHRSCRYGISGNRCGDSERTALLPKRVIDVNGRTPSGAPCILVTNGRHGLYTTLSYCWGPPSPSSKPIMLTTETLNEYQNELPWTQLPKTIQHAIEITKELGFRYLWVDRLCIIQDDRNDWREQAAKMCDIYQRSVLTLAALSAASDTSGLYPDGVYHPVLLRCGDGLGSMHVATPRHGRYSMSPLETELDKSTWNTRAWVLQEMLLSRRIVFFGKDELYWECLEKTDPQDTSEDLGGTSNRRITYGSNRFVLRSLHQARRQLMVDKVVPRMKRRGIMTSSRAVWGGIVENYTHRAMTVEGDKAAALKGIAEAFSGFFMGSEYSFGHWANMLDAGPGGLLWCGRERLKRPRVQRAPSWSWMAWDGALTWDYTRPSGRGTLLKHRFLNRDTDDFSRPSLFLEAALIEARVEKRNDRPEKRDHCRPDGTAWHEFRLAVEAPTPEHVRFEGSFDDPSDTPAMVQLVLLEDCCLVDSGPSRGTWRCDYLIVSRVEKQRRTLYRRVGWGGCTVDKRSLLEHILERPATGIYLV